MKNHSNSLFVEYGLRKNTLSWSGLSSWCWLDGTPPYSDFGCNFCFVEKNILGFNDDNQNLVNGSLFHEVVEVAFTTGELLQEQIIYKPVGRLQRGRVIDCVAALNYLKSIGISGRDSFEQWMNKDLTKFFRVIGKYDRYADGVVTDFKTASQRKKAIGNEAYFAQLQLYAFLLKEDKKKVEYIQLVYPEYEVQLTEPVNFDVGEFYFKRFSDLLIDFANVRIDELEPRCWFHKGNRFFRSRNG